MQKIVLVWETDLWQSRGSYRLIGVDVIADGDNAVTKGLDIAKQDSDLEYNIRGGHCLLVLEECEAGLADSSSEIFNTNKTESLERFLSHCSNDKGREDDDDDADHWNDENGFEWWAKDGDGNRLDAIDDDDREYIYSCMQDGYGSGVLSVSIYNEDTDEFVEYNGWWQAK